MLVYRNIIWYMKLNIFPNKIIFCAAFSPKNKINVSYLPALLR
jgi:hypothetical protein